MIIKLLRRADKSTPREDNQALRRQLILMCCTLILSSVPTLVFAVQGTDFIAPPRYTTIDAFGVNVLGGQVTGQLATVAIGGEMGLSHSISARTNLFTYPGNYGYNDKFAAGLRYTEFGEGIALVNGGPNYFLWTMQASALGDSAHFIVMRDGTYARSGAGYTANYSYEALGDKRHTLAPKNGQLVWTKPDGTEVYFGAFGDGSIAGMSRSAEKVIYPNGFTITINYTTSVRTNTGYQLKYDYINDDPGLELAKRNRYFNTGTNVPSVALSDSANWRLKNPKYVRAINNAEEYCSPTQKDPCSLSNAWPTATFNWPGGMPRAIFIDNTVFSVNNAAGVTTEFHYTAQDAALFYLADPSSVIAGYYVNSRIAPRLMAIKPAGADTPTVNYVYKNNIDFKSSYQFSYPYIVSEVGELVSANGILGAAGYSNGRTNQGNAPMSYLGYRMQVIEHQTIPTALELINFDNGQRRLLFAANYRNFVTFESDASGPSKRYEYDAGNNLARVSSLGADGTTAVTEAGYPPSCIAPTPDRNRKTCNSPVWVKDPRGNVTDYTYHPESGQLATVTLPANKHGIRPQTRYQYAQHYAHYFVAPGSKVQSDSPIWLKTQESYCINSTARSDGSCTGNDEVITRFEYEHDNLLMTGMTAYSQRDNKTLRTCYQYDIYGNRIGETQPKARLTRCN